MSRPSGLSIATASTSSPSLELVGEVPQLAADPRRDDVGSSANSSHALVPVVTVRSSRAHRRAGEHGDLDLGHGGSSYVGSGRTRRA